MIVGGVQIFSGLDPTSEGWALREITSLCGLSLGGEGGVEEDRGDPEPTPGGVEAVRGRDHLRVVSSLAG